MSKHTPPQAPGPAFWLPAVLLVCALCASLALSLQHLGGLELPGCGAESACERLGRSVWGRVPGLGWPVAHVGTAFFLGLLAAWLLRAGRFSIALRVLVGCGAALSLLFLGVMLARATFCPWCVAVHAANLGFAACMLRGGRAPAAAPGGRRAMLGFAVGALLGTAALAWPEWNARRASEARLAGSLERMRSASTESGGCAGRWALGPDPASVRVVIFTDYQCPDCRALDGQVDEVERRWPQVSVSVRHFPFCSDCNRSLRARGRNPHPHACRAALAAETAGLLGGTQGFWRLHRWLFARAGKFTQAELTGALAELGFEPAAFLRRMDGAEPAASVAADIEAGLALGLAVTPLIYINGQELLGWNAERALVRAVESTLAGDPEPRATGSDRPRSGLERLLAEWRAARPLPLPPTPANRWLLGEARPDALEVVLFGDYLDAPTRELDARIRAFAAGEPRLRYAFRLFPLDAACNEAAETRYEGACAVALAAAESLFAGQAAHLAQHERLLAGARPGGEASPRAAAALQADIQAARSVRLRAVPLCIVAGRPVRRWRLEGQAVIEAILAEALSR